MNDPGSESERRYERAVTEIRDCLRRDDTSGAHRRFAALTRELLPTIARRAEAALSRYGREMPEEGIALALREFWERLSNPQTLSETLHLERRFFQAFKLLLSDAFRKARTEKYGMTLEGKVWERLDAEANGREDAPSAGSLYEVPDPRAEDAFYTPWSQEATAHLLAHVPDPRWATALRLEADGYEREEVAARLGVSVRTVHAWTTKAKAVLQEYLRENYPWDATDRPVL